MILEKSICWALFCSDSSVIISLANIVMIYEHKETHNSSVFFITKCYYKKNNYTYHTFRLLFSYPMKFCKKFVLDFQDVGQAVLESYSRILESLAFTVLSRIEDVLYADYVTQNPSDAACKRYALSEFSQNASPESFPSPKEENYPETPGSMTLSDFMGWGLDQGDAEAKKDSTGYSDEVSKDGEVKHNHMHKLANLVTNKKISYLENLGAMRSPTARH
jgi:hypothetical protein